MGWPANVFLLFNHAQQNQTSSFWDNKCSQKWNSYHISGFGSWADSECFWAKYISYHSGHISCWHSSGVRFWREAIWVSAFVLLLLVHHCHALDVQNHILKDSQLVPQTSRLVESVWHKLESAQIGCNFHLSNAEFVAGGVLKVSSPNTMKRMVFSWGGSIKTVKICRV